MGPVKFIGLPGEFSPELVIGVPSDFDTPEGVAKYFARPDVHPTGADFTLPGPPCAWARWRHRITAHWRTPSRAPAVGRVHAGTVFSMLNCTRTEPCFALGLTGDEMGCVVGAGAPRWRRLQRVSYDRRAGQAHGWIGHAGRRTLSYVIPLCDWRLTCLGTPEECLADHEAGAMTYPDSMSGKTIARWAR